MWKLNTALSWLPRVRRHWRLDRIMKASHSTQKADQANGDAGLPKPEPEPEPEPVAADFPSFPPPPPGEMIRDPTGYWGAISARKNACPRGVFEDNSLYALYRLYECIVLDKVFGYRNMLEWFWRQSEWSVEDIPNPCDYEEPTRYAFLAGVTHLLVRSFNARIALGLTRGAPAIMSMDDIEEARNRKDEERPYEKVPMWAAEVAPLAEPLYVPTHDGVLLADELDERADPNFLQKNIVIWTPHIHFT
ncbi:hypothetical protein BDW74DRAFT_98578 [Aspergillus multicolor]|uniref:uncharacterized protein n=1 Tax=Aspergillus multicolor TaxID=41759 RepID=UPI003CCCF886